MRVQRFWMRAWKISMPVGWVYWSSLIRPDFEGLRAPYPSVHLIDVTVARVGF